MCYSSRSGACGWASCCGGSNGRRTCGNDDAQPGSRRRDGAAVSVPAPRRKKPTLADEIARTLQAFDILVEELIVRRAVSVEDFVPLLDIAERIASRTEE